MNTLATTLLSKSTSISLDDVVTHDCMLVSL